MQIPKAWLAKFSTRSKLRWDEMVLRMPQAVEGIILISIKFCAMCACLASQKLPQAREGTQATFQEHMPVAPQMP